MKLLPRSALIKTGPVDHAEWVYQPILGMLQRRRFAMVRSLLHGSYENLLEIGYGSGIFMPELRGLTKRLYGVDVHDCAHRVSAALARVGIEADLRSCSAEQLPFNDEFFDVVVAVSSLEFMPNLPRACTEIRRVLKQDGTFVAVTPGHSPVLDAGLWLLTGQSARRDFGDRRRDVLDTLYRHFRPAKKVFFPGFGGRFLPVYVGVRCHREPNTVRQGRASNASLTNGSENESRTSRNRESAS